MGATRPDLLPGEHPLGAVLDRGRREPGEVRAGARLAEQLAPVLGPIEDARQETLLLGLCPDGFDGGGHLVHPDVVAGPWHRCTCACETIVDHSLQGGGDAEPAASWLEVQPRQAEVVLGTKE